MPSAKPLSWNEIRARAISFVAEWRDETRENAEAQSFWNDWFKVFGVVRRNYVRYEERASRASTGGRGRIDAFWEGQVAVEHKSAGRSLADAEQQALDYLNSLTNVQQPRLVICSDFANFRVFELESGEHIEFPIEDFPANIERFGFLAGYESRTFQPEDEVNIKAAEMMGGLYDALNATGFTGHDLKVFLVRLMFMFFADDTGVWEKGLFSEFLETRTAEDGSDLGPLIERVFRVLDTEEDRRTNTLDETLARFPYVNGGLFRERLNIPDFDHRLRDRVVACCAFDWSAISPAVFGSMFQSVMDAEARHAIGAHYTSEPNILKVIEPLFLDELRAEFATVRNNAARLRAFHERLATLTFFDPAAGCGNFLIISYRELRLLELDVLVRLEEIAGHGQQHLNISEVSGLSKVNVDQFYAIEIEEFPARIAETAMYLMDHLMNMKLAQQFGQYFARIPLAASAHVHVANALDVDWEGILPHENCTYILGNPPFLGALKLSTEQTADRTRTFAAIPEARDLRTGRLDYVLCWYGKAMQYMAETEIRAAFVSTNSISQGEQARSVGPLLARLGFDIDFAHRTFNWTSEARGRAIVHVVIVGFSLGGRRPKKLLFDYPDINAAPIVREAKNINAWLLDAPSVILQKRRQPFIAGLPRFTVGSQPTDGGYLIVSVEQRAEVDADPIAAKYVRDYVGTDEMMGNKPMRHCLWLKDAPPQDLRNSPVLSSRIAEVKRQRSTSPTAAFRRTPGHLFTHAKHPGVPYIAMPRTSSENRRVVPMRTFTDQEIASEALMLSPTTDKWLFALLQSGAFMTWCRIVCGRLKSDLRISADLAYNAFPFPVMNDRAKTRLAAAAEAVEAARLVHAGASLGDLYDPVSMPANLIKTHNDLDRDVDGLYGFRKVPSETERATRLFERYAALVEGETLSA